MREDSLLVMCSKGRGRLRPSDEDLAVWARSYEDLLDWLYIGPTGRFQIGGHRVIDHWAEPYKNKVVLEIGCGHGHHLRYGGSDYKCYIGLDIRYKFLYTLRDRFPGTRVVSGDAYALPFRNQSIDCVLSVYCFEHLRQLRICVEEIRRVLKPEGELLMGLPAEGGALYGLGRRLTSKRYMERKYGIDYDAIVHWEHWNTFREVLVEIERRFFISSARYLPFYLPSVHLNVVVALKAQPKQST